jgi:hypothetical protein
VMVIPCKLRTTVVACGSFGRCVIIRSLLSGKRRHCKIVCGRDSGAGTPAMNELTARVLRRLSEISSGRWPSLNPNHYYKLWVRFRNRIVATSGHRSPRKD